MVYWPCPIKGCEERHLGHVPLCREHWLRLPQAARAEIRMAAQACHSDSSDLGAQERFAELRGLAIEEVEDRLAGVTS